MKTPRLVIRLALLARTLLLAICLAAASISPALAANRQQAGAPPGVRLVRSDDRGVEIAIAVPALEVSDRAIEGQLWQQVVLPGYNTLSQPGWPALPETRLLIGIPQEGEIRLEIATGPTEAYQDLHIAPVPRWAARDPEIPGQLPASTDFAWDYTPDAMAYATNAWLPAAPAALGEIGWLREQRFAELVIHPLQYNPATRAAVLHRQITLRVHFATVAARIRPAERPSLANPLEPFLDKVLLNAEAARQFRSSAAPLGALPAPSIAGEKAAEGARAPAIAGESAPGSAQGLPLVGVPAYKVLVNRTGVYRLTYASLQSAGLPVDMLDPRTFRLFDGGYGGAEVALWVVGEDDGRFDASDEVRFYGRAVDTIYTDTNVYWLTYGEGEGLRMANRSGAPTGDGLLPDHFRDTIRVEQNLLYSSGAPMAAGADHWYWNYVRSANHVPASGSYTFSLPPLASSTYTATFSYLLYSASSSPTANPDHHLQMSINYRLIYDHTWDGLVLLSGMIDIPQSYLSIGINTITLTVPGDTEATIDLIYVNWFKIAYHRTHDAQGQYFEFTQDASGVWEYHLTNVAASDPLIFDITTPQQPVLITGAAVQANGSTFDVQFEDSVAEPRAYAVVTSGQMLTPLSIALDTPSNWRSSSYGADYLIITHASFADAVQPLAAHRASQGLRVQTVDVQDIYDEFNGGLMSAQAIRDFLAYTYANWQLPAPTYVLLVGDGAYDMRNYLRFGTPTYIPPYLEFVDPWLGETASDNRFVTIVGSDTLPDMAIGRLPVNSVDEATNLVNKILTYETTPPSGDWTSKALFVSDNIPDAAGNFYLLSDQASYHVPSSYTIGKVYYGQTHTTVDATRAAIVNAINDGQMFVNYVGHGSITGWASEKIFRRDNEVLLLTNGGKLPIMLPMTCYEGYFHHPDPAITSLEEALIRRDGGGSVAGWASSGLGIAHGHDYLNRAFFDALYCDGVDRLGLATIAGKLYLYNSTVAYRDLVDTFNLLGDPALRLPVTSYDCVEMSLVPGWNQVSLAVQPLDPSPAAALRSLGPAWQQAKAWDGATQSWRSAAPALPSWATTLTAIDARYGLWLQLSDFASLFVHGAKFSSGAQIPLYAGWNLLGAPITASTPITAAWGSLPWMEAWAYDANSGTWDSATPSGGSLTTWDPSRGYWLKLTADATLTTP